MKSSRSAKTKTEKEQEAELRLRNKPFTQQPKFDSSLKWNGTSATFRIFSRALEGHLVMGGAEYMTNPKFIQEYQNFGAEYLNYKSFWEAYKVSHPQANFDRHYLYGMLMLATQAQQHKTLMKYEDSKDGILAWAELKEENEYNGSRELDWNNWSKWPQFLTLPGMQGVLQPILTSCKSLSKN